MRSTNTILVTLLLITGAVGSPRAQCVPPPPGLVSWWPGDGSPEDVAGANHGVLSGGASFAAGMVAEGFAFDGLDGHFDGGNDPSVRPEFPFTVDFWIHRSSATDFYAVTSSDTSGNGLYSGFLVLVSADGAVITGIGNNGGNCSALFRRNHLTVAGLVPVGSWHHVAVVFDTPSLHLVYVDGAVQVTTPSGSATSMSYALGNRLQIGRAFDPNAASFVCADGMIDEVELHAGSIDPADIQAVFEAGADGKCKDVTPAMDFGDAPFPYPTAMSGDGACHLIIPGIFLGTQIDADEDGHLDGAADGDDLDGVDDEDGVQFATPLVPGLLTNIEVVASVAGLLNLWIDWEVDGGWTECEDAVLIAEPLSPGLNQVSFFVPATGHGERTTYARFRFCTSPGLLWSGLAHDGEVEDYEVVIHDDPSGVSDVTVGGLALGQNFPNPFYPRTTISFALIRDSLAQVTIYDLAGRQVRQLLGERRGVGEHFVVWDARDDGGAGVASGTYLYELRVDGRPVQVRKAILSR